MEFGTLQLPDVEGDWYYMLLKPPNFDPNKKYPLLVQVYSGKHSEVATNGYVYCHFLCTSNNVFYSKLV